MSGWWLCSYWRFRQLLWLRARTRSIGTIMSCNTMILPTPAGVTVGDPADKIARTYGKPQRYTRYESGEENFVYRDQYDIHIAFSVEKGRITRIGIVGYE